MIAPGSLEGGATGRARVWCHGWPAVICDVAEPWAHGTVLRATGYPSYYDFNGAYLTQSRAVARRRRARVLVVREAGVAVGFAQLEREGSAAEITKVYVHPDYRGGGRGTALTRAAIEAAGDVADLWIVADDEGRAKTIYGRLGFRTVWTRMHFLRTP